MLYITSASYVSDYQIRLLFSDTSEGIVNLKHALFEDPRPIIRELQSLEKFRSFHVDMDTVTWENGVDFAPEFLRDNVVTWLTQNPETTHQTNE